MESEFLFNYCKRIALALLNRQDRFERKKMQYIYTLLTLSKSKTFTIQKLVNEKCEFTKIADNSE